MKRTAFKLLALVSLFCSGLAFAQQDINLFQTAGTALGAPSNYGTSPGAVVVNGVNAFVTNTVTVAGSGVFEVGPTGSANTASNAFFDEITDGTNPMGAMTNFGSTPGAVKALSSNVSLFMGTVAVGTGAPLAVSLNSTISEVSPTTAANTASNPFFNNISDGTHALTAAVSAWGVAPTGTEVLGVNVNCVVGCGGSSTTISLIPETSGGETTFHFVAAASNNATSLKASAGQLYSVDVFNNAAYPVFVKFYNTASSPSSCGATNLIKVVGTQSGTQHTIKTEEGWPFATGIGYCAVKGIADSDNTALLASDASFDGSYK